MKIVCIATHPDDETLGCGGTLLRHKKEGAEIHWIIATSATGPNFTDLDLSTQNQQIDTVAQSYGFNTINKLNLPATMLDQIPENTIIPKLIEAVNDINADIVFLNHQGDAHSDHRIIHHCTLAALKPFRSSQAIKKIYAMETLSETDQAGPNSTYPFHPTTYINISDVIDEKIKIFETFLSEQQTYPKPREASAIRALARVRGASVGLPYAEAFMLIREVR